MDTQDIEIEAKNSLSMEEIIQFRDHQLSREILSCGVNTDHNILHFGAGYLNGFLFKYLVDAVRNKHVNELLVQYNAIDVDSEKIQDLIDLNQDANIALYPSVIDMQTFLDEDNGEYDWTVITGIFDKKLYGENQFQFVDKIISESLNRSREGVIFTFDTSVDPHPDYSVHTMFGYTQHFSRFKISRLNEHNYVICINKYYHSINN